jgi:uncharacterized protein (DUF1800 family)
VNESNSAEAPIRVVSANLSPAEVAAVTAVLEAAVEEELDELHSEVPTAPTAWSRSQRSLREPQHPGAGVWRAFSG